MSRSNLENLYELHNDIITQKDAMEVAKATLKNKSKGL